ncbi:MAG: hypothetical protein JXA21_15430 [Anaerolineae bacterium]|nr:hypothetical protein [Anaerolineae bacterium]
MIGQVTFINREEQLALIETLVHEVNSLRLLCIQAGGGIGKTRLLQKIHQSYTEPEYAKSLAVSTIIDFDDQTFHIPLNVEHRIAQGLGEDNFQRYLRALWDWRKLEAAGLSEERVSSERERTAQMFVECFNAVSATKRVILLFDTLEAIAQTDVWTYALQLGLNLKNALLIFAGRDAGDFYNSLPPALKEMAQFIELEPLASLATESYMQAKQVLLNISLSSDLLRKIAWLSEGKPILIDLAIEWLARDIPSGWMLDYTYEELEAISGAEKQKRQQEFEERLVQQIAKTERRIDQLMLTMSHIYPLDAKLIGVLSGESVEVAQQLFEEFKMSALVKSLPDGRISLHDEVRRMICDYVWSQVDPSGDRRRWYSKQFIHHLNDEVADLKRQIAHILNEKDATLIQFMKREVLERKIWVLEEQRLQHTLYLSASQGMKIFMDLFDKATEVYRSQVRRTLLAEVRKYWLALTSEQLYELNIRHAKLAFDMNEYAEAKKVLLEALNGDLLHPLQRTELLRLLGNTEIRLGNLREGIAQFQEARNIADTIEDALARTTKLAEVQNALGWGNRLLGQIDLAVREYEAAFNCAIQLKGKEGLIASILNNLGYAYYLQGHSDTGRRYCLQALAVVPPSDIQQLGLVNSTLGEICLGLGQYSEASQYYEAALSSFKDIANNEGQAIVHMEISHSKRHLASMNVSQSPDERESLLLSALENARASIQICERYNLRKDIPLCYYEIGRVLIDLRSFDDASAYLEKSYPQNLQRAGGFALADLTALAEIAYQQRDYQKVERWVGETQNPENRDRLLETQRADSELFYGRLLRFLAEAYIEQARYDAALPTYVKALTHIAHHGGYGAYRMDQELDRLKSHIAKLPAAVRTSWCDRFIESWKASINSSQYPEVLAEVRLAKMM